MYLGKAIGTQWLTSQNALPKWKEQTHIPVLITLPKYLEQPALGWPVVMMVHGITGEKEDHLLLAQQYSQQGISNHFHRFTLPWPKVFGIALRIPRDLKNFSNSSSPGVL